jgi:hypothetical protein
MAIELNEEIGGRLLIISVTGKLTREDYKSFVPKVEELILKSGKIRVVFEMRDFHGWDAGALWEDIKFDIRHFSDIEFLALIGDKKWEKGMSIFCKPFTKAQIKYFDLTEIYKAYEWIREGLEDKAS